MPTVKEALRKPKIITLDTVEPKAINWLWYPYIPAGTVTALYGQGGLGKSFLTCDLASRLSNGEALPDSPPPAAKQKVLMLSAEDDYPTVLVPRLMKMRANLSNIAVPDYQFVLDKDGMRNVVELMRSFAATIVFIDPIVYYAGGKMDMNKSNEVRAMMEGLKTGASETGSTVLIVGHIRKSQEGGDSNQMMGSADWINAARSSLFVTRTNDGTKIMKHTKTNYGQTGPARAFYVDDDGFHWGDTYDEEDLPMPSKPARRDSAITFLKTILANGPLPSNEVMALAKEQNISPATLNRAKVGVAESFFSKSMGPAWRLLPGVERPGVDEA